MFLLPARTLPTQDSVMRSLPLAGLRRGLLLLTALLVFAPITYASTPAGTDILPQKNLAEQHYGNDAPWYEANIPFFDCSDAEITAVYYYRWELWKAHLKDLGQMGYISTEFLNDVNWSIHPWQSLNDATAYHIHEGRWVKDSRYINDYMNYMYENGGNDRHFSESIADAVYSAYLVNSDKVQATRNLASMENIYDAWNDHFERAKGLYFIEPLLDATEFTISSIDASGGWWGFRGGQAFRPTINSFMYADAVAIGKLAAIAGDRRAADGFARRAAALKAQVQGALWNDQMQDFVDRYKVNNQYVHYWDFIRGRELAGYAPWYYGLPDNDPKYAESWKRILAKDGFAGAGGLRTVEPSYEHYMQQYIYEPKTNPAAPECQWNGPAWPFDTTMVLGGLANLLNDYSQDVMHPTNYVSLLRQYARQHYLNGMLDLQEDYNPDTGAVIVGLPRSHHYNHSGYCDLVITGLAGLRPSADDNLVVNPLVDDSIQYFCLENVNYHGHLVTILYDKDGKHYNKGAGLSIYVDGVASVPAGPLARKSIAISPAPEGSAVNRPVDLAINVTKNGYPAVSASVNNNPDDLYQAVDGRIWFFPNVRNYWSTEGSTNEKDWYALDFGQLTTISGAELYFYGDDTKFKAPTDYKVQAWDGADWKDIAGISAEPAVPIANGENVIHFPPIQTGKMRVLMTNAKNAATGLVELKVF
jgi:hypothetical protein